MEKWEYKILWFKPPKTLGKIILPYKEIEKMLNEHGEKGWELVTILNTIRFVKSITFRAGGAETTEFSLLLKKRK